ncbi:MAG: tetratricopeptide repeat protein, partial [Armatimonadetes bacterium]|nr:tetratricopeptide repeat protein [Armatimonadota bacterium]
AMGAYALYAESPSLRRKLPVIGFFALGLLAKPMLVTLPVVLLLLDYWPLHRFSFDGKKQGTPLRALLVEKLPLFVLSGASCVITYFAQRTGGSMSVAGQLPFVIRAGNALLSYFRYIEKMLWPRDLAILYPYTPASVPTWTQIYAAAAALILITALIIWLGRRHRYLPVGWLWYVGTLLPVVGLVQVGEQTMADRYTYVPLIGLFIMIAWLVPELLRRVSPSPRLPILLGIPAIAVIASMAIVARHQVGFWKDSVTLFEHTVAVTKDNYTGHTNLGLALSDEGRLEAAIEAYQAAVKILPNEVEAHADLAVLFYNTGRYAEAWKEVHTSRRLGFEPNPQFLADLAQEQPEPK